MSRSFTGYASDEAPSQYQVGRVRRTQTRTITVDFNAALAPDATIASVLWQTNAPWVAYMSNAAISGRKVTVRVVFQFSGIANLKATMTDSTGTVRNYEFEFDVSDCPMYPDTVYPNSTGPYSLTATA